LPKIARAVTKAAPRLTKGIGRVAKTLHRNPQTRHLLKTVPTIARRTVGRIAHQAARGHAVTPRTAVRTLARQARTVLGNPRHRALALRRHHRLERNFHRAYGRGMARPHWRWGRGRRWYGRYPYGYRRGGMVRGGAPVVGGVAPGVPGMTYHPGVAGPVGTVGGGVRYGQIVGGRCTCGPCPACGTPGATPIAAAVPQYCRCCGQVLR
jgi:hypothetical protein